MFAIGIVASIAALVLLLAGTALPIVLLAVALFSIGNTTFAVVLSPFLTEHSEPEHRNELFAVQFANPERDQHRGCASSAASWADLDRALALGLQGRAFTA